MSDDSRSERERLKEEYKAHYRKMRETKERASRARKTQNIAQALKNMDKSQMLDSFDDFLYSVKHKLASVEARLDVAMESLIEEDKQTIEGQQLDEEMTKEKAKDTLRQVKLEMGLLYKEIEKQADSIKVNKTIGSGSQEDQSGESTEDQQ
jgi:exonuclease VII large subunit